MKENLSQNDVNLIKLKIDRAYFSLVRTYGPFFLALILAYFYGKNKTTSHDEKITSNFDAIYLIVVVFFLIVFSIFIFRDYKNKVIPYKKELSSGTKDVITFRVRKYFDPVYKKFLLYHPVKENKYILLTEEEYNSIENGQELELQSGTNTGIVLALKLNNKLMADVEEFAF